MPHIITLAALISVGRRDQTLCAGQKTKSGKLDKLDKGGRGGMEQMSKERQRERRNGEKNQSTKHIK
jgi:hypothetical protein